MATNDLIAPDYLFKINGFIYSVATFWSLLFLIIFDK